MDEYEGLHMSNIISFVSQKGGVGKTTSAINLATAFAFGGYSVLLIDLDPQSSVRFSMGVNNIPSVGIKELFLDAGTPITELVQHTELDNMGFIFSNIDTLDQEREILNASNDPCSLLNRLKVGSDEYDFIIVDAPSSTNNMAVNAICCSDLLILPIQCESLAIKSLKRFLKAFNDLQSNFEERELKIAGILLTMYDRTIEVHRKVAQQIYRVLTDSVFETIIPRNDAIVEASALGKSVITYKLNSIGATAYIRLMNELVDKFSLR